MCSLNEAGFFFFSDTVYAPVSASLGISLGWSCGACMIYEASPLRIASCFSLKNESDPLNISKVINLSFIRFSKFNSISILFGCHINQLRLFRHCCRLTVLLISHFFFWYHSLSHPLFSPLAPCSPLNGEVLLTHRVP